MSDAILTCACLNKFYSKGAVHALIDVDLKIQRGKVIGLLGPNGSGKTTLLKIAAGLLQPTSGGIFIDGKPIGTESKKIVSYMPDSDYLPNWMKPSDLMDYFSDFYADFDKPKAREMMARLNMPQIRMKKMSKGTKEKLQLCLVMSRNAKLYLLDEPIGGVDPAARDYILDTIISSYNREASIIISTHLISDVEKVLDEALFINYGRIVRTFDTLPVEGKTLDTIFREEYRCF